MRLINMSGGNTPPPGDIAGKGFTSAYGPASIVHASGFGDGMCLSPFPPGTWTNGEIVICDRGAIARVEKGQNVLDGGAGGFVLSNTAAEGESVVGDPHFLPAVHIGFIDAQVLEAWVLDGGAGHTASIAGATLDIDPANGDIMADFSSRGANRALPDIIVPSVTAPGVDIIAAFGTDGDIEWSFLSGTSMSGPHTAGAGALLSALHPTQLVPRRDSVCAYDHGLDVGVEGGWSDACRPIRHGRWSD